MNKNIVSSDELLEDFCHQVGLNYSYPYSSKKEIYHFLIERDDSEFVVVDGEEADHGIIRYYSYDSETIDRELLATKTVNGGDDEDIEFTRSGKLIFSTCAIEILRDRIWGD